MITGVPTETGQFAVGVCTEEFNSTGQLLTRTSRDFQFNVLECDVLVEASIDAVPTGEDQHFEINSCGVTELLLRNQSQLESRISKYSWQITNDNNQTLFDDDGGPELRDLSFEFPGLGNYTAEMVVNEGLLCADTAFITINLFPSIEADFSFEYDTCMAGPVIFSDSSSTGASSITDWSWDFGNGITSRIQNPEIIFDLPGEREALLVVTDINDCSDNITRTIPYFPVPEQVIIEPTKFIGCEPASIFFNNLSNPIDSTYDIVWNFGDGSEGSTEVSPTHIFNEPGTFDIELSIISPIGCSTDRTFGSFIEILESPEASFNFFPDEPSILEPTIKFTNTSVFAGSYNWLFGDGNNSLEFSPTHTYQDTGIFNAVLTVFHPETMCPDTASALIDIKPFVNLIYPNAFTPNGDGKNEEFFGVGPVDGLTDFTLSIFNRWGEEIFFSEDPRSHWNGRKNETGELYQQGTYTYLAKYIDPRGENIRAEGRVTLLK